MKLGHLEPTHSTATLLAQILDVQNKLRKSISVGVSARKPRLNEPFEKLPRIVISYNSGHFEPRSISLKSLQRLKIQPICQYRPVHAFPRRL